MNVQSHRSAGSSQLARYRSREFTHARGLPRDKEEQAPEAGLSQQEAPVLFLPEPGPLSPPPGGPPGAWGLWWGRSRKLPMHEGCLWAFLLLWRKFPIWSYPFWMFFLLSPHPEMQLTHVKARGQEINMPQRKITGRTRKSKTEPPECGRPGGAFHWAVPHTFQPKALSQAATTTPTSALHSWRQGGPSTSGTLGDLLSGPRVCPGRLQSLEGKVIHPSPSPSGPPPCSPAP